MYISLWIGVHYFIQLSPSKQDQSSLHDHAKQDMYLSLWTGVHHFIQLSPSKQRSKQPTWSLGQGHSTDFVPIVGIDCKSTTRVKIKCVRLLIRFRGVAAANCAVPQAINDVCESMLVEPFQFFCLVYFDSWEEKSWRQMNQNWLRPFSYTKIEKKIQKKAKLLVAQYHKTKVWKRCL